MSPFLGWLSMPHWKQQRVIGYERARMCLRRFFHCGCEIFSRFEPLSMDFFSELSPRRWFTMARCKKKQAKHTGPAAARASKSVDVQDGKS